MPRRLVALSTSAIATIYFAGFIATRSADAGMAAATSTAAPLPSSTTAPAPTSTSQPTAVVGASAPTTTSTTAPSASTTSARTATTSPTSALTATSGYKDGTYTGSGTSRRGGVNVSVTVQSGKLTNVQITSVSTEYPVSRIASLPSQVISKQSAQVNTISGATYSTQAFVQAVQQALSKAG